MKNHKTPKHSNGIPFFLLNALLIVGLAGVAVFVQRNDSDIQPIAPAATVPGTTASSETAPAIQTGTPTSGTAPTPAPAAAIPATIAPTATTVTPTATPVAVPKIVRHRSDDDGN